MRNRTRTIVLLALAGCAASGGGTDVEEFTSGPGKTDRIEPAAPGLAYTASCARALYDALRATKVTRDEIRVGPDDLARFTGSDRTAVDAFLAEHADWDLAEDPLVLKTLDLHDLETGGRVVEIVARRTTFLYVFTQSGGLVVTLRDDATQWYCGRPEEEPAEAAPSAACVYVMVKSIPHGDDESVDYSADFPGDGTEPDGRAMVAMERYAADTGATEAFALHVEGRMWEASDSRSQGAALMLSRADKPEDPTGYVVGGGADNYQVLFRVSADEAPQIACLAGNG